jgi:hypothetical protein
MLGFAIIAVGVLVTSTSRAQMILPLPPDLDSLPAFRLSGGAASAGSFSDFAELDIAENSSIGALFEFSPLRLTDPEGWFKHLTAYTTINKGSGSEKADAGGFDPGDLLFPLSKDISAMIGFHHSIYRMRGRASHKGDDRHEVGVFADYSLQQRKLSGDSTVVPGDPAISLELPLNVSTWHIGVKYSWTTRKMDTSAYEDVYRAKIAMDSAESMFRNARMKFDSLEGPADSSEVKLAEELLEISKRNYENIACPHKIVRLTMGLYYINIQIAENTMDSFRAVLDRTDLRDAYRGVGLKFAFQYRSFGYEYDYRYILTTDPDVKGLTGSSFATRISISGQILDAF